MGFRIWRKKSRSNLAEKNSRSKRAEENDRLLLKEQIKFSDGKCNPIRIFTEKELSKATHNYHPNLLVSPHFYELYRGELGVTKDWPILVNKVNNFPNLKERIINEVVAVSQMKHKHVVKLLGCCLETDLPILVYECSHVHKTLSDLIINDHRCSLLSWESRLRIASEVANAVTYIHTFSSRPIIHRDIKLANIFLDHQDVARLFGFSLCIRIPDGQTHVDDPAKGTIGYLDPIYMKMGHASEKADVYSFGVVLFEILSGNFWVKFQKETNYSGDFESRMRGLIAQDRHLRQIVDPRIAGVEDERPEMIDVAKELRHIWKTTQVQLQ